MSLCLLDAARTAMDEAAASITDRMLGMLRLLTCDENG
jgi:hypothetical protein